MARSPITGKQEVVWHPATPPTIVDGDQEAHPAYGLIHASRSSCTPGAVLFDSDLRHRHVITITLESATRKRELSRDWIFGRKRLVEVQMSEAQWAGFVSSMNTSGVSCTIRVLPEDFNIAGLEFAPRIAESLAEVHGAAEKVFGRIDAAVKEWDALDPKAGVKERRAVFAKIRNAVEHAKSNMGFAATSLSDYAENVVQKARADIEAMVVGKAEQLGLSAADTSKVLELDGGDGI